MYEGATNMAAAKEEWRERERESVSFSNIRI
jgi:hypothetical protein